MCIVSSGIFILSEGWYKNIDYPIDTLIIPGLPQKEEYKAGKEILNWIGEQSGKVRRICSVCAGAFMLAEAGITTGMDLALALIEEDLEKSFALQIARMSPRNLFLNTFGITPGQYRRSFKTSFG